MRLLIKYKRRNKLNNSAWNYIPLTSAVKIFDSLRQPINSKERAKRIEGKKDSDLFPYYGATGQVGYIDDFLIDGEYILLREDGAPFLDALAKKAYIINGKSWVNNHAHILQSKTNNKFLYFYLNYFDYKDYVSGTTRLKLTQARMKQIPVPVPSLPEQERIVARIEELFSELDKAVETLKTTKQQLAVYRQAVYASIFDHGTLRPITDFFEISGGLTKNSKRHEFHTKMPYLRVANVYYNFLDLREIKQIGVMPNEIERTLLQKDDLLFVEGNGSKSQIGRVAIWDGSIKNCLHQNHLIKGRPIGGMLPKYALFYLISGYGRKQILDIASSTSGLYTLSINKIKNLKIPYIDIDDQKKSLELIDSRLSCCDQIERTVDTALQQAEAMRQSILKQAFEGGL